MSRTFSQLTYDDRLDIERMLSVNESVSTIADATGFSHQSITREIIRSRVNEGRAKTYNSRWNGCVHQRTCRVIGICDICLTTASRCASCRMINCVKTCQKFEANSCPRLEKAPHCCNGCVSYKNCSYTRFSYHAKAAQIRADELRVSSRSGVNLTEDELALIVRIAAPLIENGQPPAQIWREHGDQLPCCERSFYRHVGNGDMPGIIKLNLPFAPRYKPRTSDKPPTRTNIAKEVLEGRTYADFLLLSDEERAGAIEMDCVCGPLGEKSALLTIYFRPWKFQFIDLLWEKNSVSVALHFDHMASFLEPKFPSCTLVDRGTEFSWAEGIETSGASGEKRTSLYYCDPMRSGQRGASENNHRFIRRIIPKGTSLEELTEVDVAILTSHINSVPRKTLGGKSPMQLAMQHLPEDFFKEYGLELIPSDKVVLKPKLLRP